jgi:holo-[acyl-carrier protein] synthase
MSEILQGVDIVDVEKIRGVMERRPPFASEVFSEEERRYCLSRRDPYVHFAGRFAAKEACLKALGTGLSAQGIDSGLREIEVLPDRSGRPVLRLSGWMEKIRRKKGVDQLTVSISHSAGTAISTVILVRRSRERPDPGKK